MFLKDCCQLYDKLSIENQAFALLHPFPEFLIIFYFIELHIQYSVNHDNQYMFIVLSSSALNYSQYEGSLSHAHLEPKID